MQIILQRRLAFHITLHVWGVHGSFRRLLLLWLQSAVARQVREP